MKTFREIKPPFASEADGELAKRVQLTLIANRPSFCRVDVGAQGGTVTLSGMAPTFFLRQLAVATTKRVAGVRQVVDDIEVAHPRHIAR
jgi:osmotically-inducible protein OsmY